MPSSMQELRVRLVLASASPRRCRLLAGEGYDLVVDPAGVDESLPPGSYEPSEPVESGRRAAQLIAVRKAVAVAARRPGEIVLGADTIVVTEDGSILGQPRDRAESRAMIERLSGRSHWVHTGVAVVRDEAVCDAADTARVRFRPLSPPEIDAYVASGEGDDKAGAYGYQGLGRGLVESVEGDEQTVIGLPLRLVADLVGMMERGLQRMKP